MIRGFSNTTVQLSGTSQDTTQPAPIRTLLPILMLPITLAPAPIKTLSPFRDSANIFLGCNVGLMALGFVQI
jgi:hypothetical protein